MKPILYTMALIGVLLLTGCANAGKDQTVMSRDLVILDASASTASFGGELRSYHWTQIQGESVALSGEDSIQATFTAPIVTQTSMLIFRLKTIEVGELESYDTVVITVNPHPNDLQVRNITVTEITDHSAVIAWEGNPHAKTWLFVHEENTTSPKYRASGNRYTYTALNPGYAFTVYVQGEGSSTVAEKEFATLKEQESNFEPVSNQTYYVDQNISASCTNYSPVTRKCGEGNATAYKTLAEVNTQLNAGEEALIREGTYMDARIEPHNSGKDGKYIVYKAYKGEQVRISGNRKQKTLASLVGKSYIWIEGIALTHTTGRYLVIKDSDHIVLKHNKTYASDTETTSVWQKIVFENTTYLYSEGNRYDSGDIPVQFDLIGESGLKFAVFYQDTFLRATHNIWGTVSYEESAKDPLKYTAFIACDINPLYHTGLGLGAGTESGHGKFYLIQGNDIHGSGTQTYQSKYCQTNNGQDCDGHDPALYLMGEETIVRDNRFFHNNNHILLRWSSADFWKGAKVPKERLTLTKNRIYNNTFYDAYIPEKIQNTLNDYSGLMIAAEGANLENSDENYTRDSNGKRIKNIGEFYDNKIFNNIFSRYQNRRYGAGLVFINYHMINHRPNTQASTHDNTIEYNIFYNDGDDFNIRWHSVLAPKDTYILSDLQNTDSRQWRHNISDDPAMADPEDANFTLQIGSPALDAGKVHAIATNSGNLSTALEVDDPYVFFAIDSWHMQWHQTLNSALKSDLIKIGDGEPVRIKSIDYRHRSIQLQSPRSWDAGDGIIYCAKGVCPAGETPAIGRVIISR